MTIQQSLEAISDPSRRKILELLKSGEMTVGELLEHFDITGASMSHHLTKLKSAGLVSTRRDGQNIFYAIETSVFEDVASYLVEFFSRRRSKR